MEIFFYRLTVLASSARVQTMDRHTEVLVVGGGLGGVAAAIAALEAGRHVVLSEESPWLGGQLTSQAVPPDEHPEIENRGCSSSYRRLRDALRQHYRDWYPLLAARGADLLNPGDGWVSPICHEPRVAVLVLEAMLGPWQAAGRLKILRDSTPVAATLDGDRIGAIEFDSPDGRFTVEAVVVIDATELGDLLPLTDAEHAVGAESRAETGEAFALETADPLDQQGITWVMAVSHHAGEDHTIDKPQQYEHWLDYRHPHWHGRSQLDWRGPGLPGTKYQVQPNPDTNPQHWYMDHRDLPKEPDLWTYRRIIARNNHTPGYFASDVTLLNWPQNDYTGGPIVGVPDEEAAAHLEGSRQLTLSLLHWLQTVGGLPGLKPEPGVLGTEDGLALRPYIRESRRIKALTTIVAEDVLVQFAGERGRHYADCVGVGHYYWMDVHPSTSGAGGLGGVPSPFEIPLTALVPRRVTNLLAGAKNIGTTHLSNGCYRVHPVEWSVGEASGTAAALLVEKGEPVQALSQQELTAEVQRRLAALGAPLSW